MVVLHTGQLSIQEQSMMLRDGLEVLVGTPGRIVDCLQSRYLVLNQCNYVVLDEADRMLEMGFEQQV
jgi:ATP-dependent RNA helicase DDX23/PRP28